MCASTDDPVIVTTGGSVSEHMSRHVFTVREDCSLTAAVDAVLASKHRHVVVVDSRGGLEGVLRAEVITTAWMTRFGDRHRLVRDLISGPRVHLTPDASMHTAASTMLSYSVDALAVLEADGRLVGVLTWADIVAMVARRE